MLSRIPQYQPLEETSDSPQPVRTTNPRVELPSPAIWTPPPNGQTPRSTNRTPSSTSRTSQPFYPIARTVPPFHSTPRPTPPLHSTARPTSLNYPIANTAQTLHSTASRTGPLYSTAPSTPPPFDPAARPIIIQPVQTELIVLMPMSFGKSPVRMRCPECRTQQLTRTKRKIGEANWAYCEIIFRVTLILSCLLLFPVLLLPCAFVALCLPSQMDVEHSCSNCNHVLGTSHPPVRTSNSQPRQ